ncbi:nucleotide sugar dehydrogenase [Clostridium magnum]|uniref:UDP-N-acetyl-D-glucosamine 6-dehydrogenase n=1 Tax=Clostridium magnum DSM 2767 TaxID=1121326 RepID=A0A161Y5X7_9CLOT|nr:nucleotide sugar dehydrogenase [Clostridium magnum]KZL93679.1 UDP-N-acetyl-D-glucosamine 6-dehydrogenase [Clostridium magnum DSM 2767]SHI92481.1 UDP-N-acetyl-D-mannosaminuronic acid dehydrogenase [Clostridium magnum DSM 2767]
MNVYVFGLGHIGLPLAASIALNNKQVQGIDINPDTITNIKTKNIIMYEYYNGKHISEIILDLIKQKKLAVSTKFKRIDNQPSVFIITVGIGTKEDNSQDLSPIQSVIDELLPNLVPRDLLIFRTTMIPGTCENFILPQLEALSIPVYLAYCPETIAETHAFEEFRNNPKVLAGINEESYKAAEDFLKSLSDAPIYKASNIRTAEMVKVAQNIQRDVNIALINELGEAASALNIDIYELQNLANTHPRVKLLQPGPGVGGYCLPNALGYLKEALVNLNVPLNLTHIARSINDEKPLKVVQKIKEALKDANKDISDSSIAVVGLAMKDYCADCRLSPSLNIVDCLLKEGAKVKAYDPVVPLIYDFQTSSFKECIKDVDCLVIAAKQPGITFDLPEMESLMESPLIVVDTRNTFPYYDKVTLYKI